MWTPTLAALSALLAAVLAYSAFVTGATVGGAGGGVGVDEAKAMDAGEDSGETLGGRTSGRNSLGKMRPSLNPACMCTYDVSHARNEWCFIGCTRRVHPLGFQALFVAAAWSAAWPRLWRASVVRVRGRHAKDGRPRSVPVVLGTTSTHQQT